MEQARILKRKEIPKSLWKKRSDLLKYQVKGCDEC